jgi:hypothetical protein
MRSSIFLIIGACLVFLVTDALVLERQDNPAVVAFHLDRVRRKPPSRTGRGKRSIDSPLDNEGFLWTVTLLIGTPPQSTSLLLDTGSSDLVVETDSSNICASQPVVCSGLGACQHSPSCV